MSLVGLQVALQVFHGFFFPFARSCKSCLLGDFGFSFFLAGSADAFSAFCFFSPVVLDQGLLGDA